MSVGAADRLYGCPRSAIAQLPGLLQCAAMSGRRLSRICLLLISWGGIDPGHLGSRWGVSLRGYTG